MRILRNYLVAGACLVSSIGCPENRENNPGEVIQIQSQVARACGDAVYYYETRNGIDMCVGNCLIECQEAQNQGLRVEIPIQGNSQ